MRVALKKALAGTAAVASIATIAPFIGAGVASAATNNGVSTINPTSGTASGTPFNLSLPAPSKCAGDNLAGYNWQSFMVPATVDPNTLTFTATGPTAVGGEFRVPLFDGAGTPMTDQAPNIGSAVVSLPQFSFAVLDGVVPSGDYTVGIACTLGGARTIDSYWTQNLTFTTTGGSTSFAVPAPPSAPSAPQNVLVTPGNGTLSVVFAAPATGNPATYTYTATATPVGGGTAVTASGSTSPLAITGLTNGTAYDVTVTATNTQGTGPASAAITATPSVVYSAPVVTASPGSAVGTVDVIWTAAGGSPTGYDVTISPAPTSGPATQTVSASGPLAASFANLGTGVHTVTVTPTGYPAGESAPAGTDTATPVSGDGTPATLIQTIQVQREQVNAIVFEQDCDGPGTAEAFGTDTCIVDLGEAVLDGAGEYYETTGELWPIRVIDHRDTDKGWKITGVIDPLFEDGAKSFDANALGWTPQEISQSAALSGGYAMDVQPGPVVAPWSSDQALKNGAILAQSVANGLVQQGLGTAVYSADLAIKIPVNVASGEYSADITFTLVNKTP